MVLSVAESLGIPTNDSSVLKLITIIQSHHGSKELGAIADPMCFEAYIVSALGNLSAQGNNILNLLEES